MKRRGKKRHAPCLSRSEEMSALEVYGSSKDSGSSVACFLNPEGDEDASPAVAATRESKRTQLQTTR